MGDLVPEAEVVYYPSIIEEGGGGLEKLFIFWGREIVFRRWDSTKG